MTRPAANGRGGRGHPRLGAALLGVLVLAAAVGPSLIAAATGRSFDAQDLAYGCRPPSFGHPFGTDAFGRDLLLRCLCGLQLSLLIGASAAVVSVVLGSCYGAIAGYVGGRLDVLMMRTVDVLYALPFVFLVILLTCIFGRSLPLLFVGLGAVSWLSCARIVRTQVRTMRRGDMVAALTVMGASHLRIVCGHLLPNAAGVVVVMFTLGVPAMVLEEAFLSFIGLGVQAPHASLGSLLGEGASQMLLAWWQLAFPAATLATLLLSLNLLGDALQAALHPRA